MSQENLHDAREVLARDKYFTLRPRPLEQWIWKQKIPPSAERVFWLHWQEGMRQGWCSAIPLKRVAALCSIDLSRVTRAYKLLAKLGLLRRQDTGRDPARPYQQGVSITEIRIPRELVLELSRHPNRSRGQSVGRGLASETTGPSQVPPKAAGVPSPSEQIEAGAPADNTAIDPFVGMRGRERMRAIENLLGHMSSSERKRYDEASRTHTPSLTFDGDSCLSPEQRRTVLQLLSVLASKPIVKPSQNPTPAQPITPCIPRRLSLLEIAKIHKELRELPREADHTELVRQVTWSVEKGSLCRFTPLHGIRIALKKIRLGEWTRPHRMPPNWARPIFLGSGGDALPETCRSA